VADKFALGIEITADSAKARAGLAETRRALLATFDDGKASASGLAASMDAVSARSQAIKSSLSALNVRSSSDIKAEMASVARTISSLTSNGAGANDIARAGAAAQARIAALNAELNGTVAAGNAAGGSLAGLGVRMAALAAAALAAREAVQLFKSTVDTGIKFDSLKTQYTFANNGDARMAADEMAYAAQLSNRLGLELAGTTQAYGKLQAAARGTVLEGRATRDIFTAVASAASVNGLAAEEQAGALLAVSQMMSKGTISAEELRGQLGERLPGAFAIAAKAMSVTEAEFSKMLESGTLSAAQFLPRFAEALQASVNDALPAAEKSARAQLQRLENAFTEFKLRIASSGLLDKVAEQLERVLDHIAKLADSGELERLASGLAKAFGNAVTFMADAAIVAERFSGVLVGLAQALAALVVGGKVLAVFATPATAAGLAATGTAAGGAAVGVGALAAAMRLLAGGVVGAALIYGAEKLIEWGAKASEARAQAQALDAELRKLIDSNSEHASQARLDAEALTEFGDAAFAAYEKSIQGARDYAAAKVVDLTKTNKDGRNDEAIAFYREQAAAYNAFIDTVLAGEKLRREQVQITGQILAKEAEREKLLVGDVKKTRAEAIAEEIKGYEKLVEAIGKAREESQKEAEEARKRAADFRDKAADKQLSASDKATQIREGDLPQDEKRFLDQQRAVDAQSQGSYAAARAAVAQIEGRGKDFEKYSKEAEKFLDRAMKFAESAQDADLIEEIGTQQAGVDTVRARAEDKNAADADQRAGALMDQLNTAQTKLKELQGEAATIQVNAEIASAINKLTEVETKLAALQDKTVTVTVNTVSTGTAPAAAAPADAGPLPEFAYGGRLPGHAPHDRADNQLYWGTPGEWVIQRPAVRHYGAAFIAAVNAMKLPKFAFGGEIGGMTGVRTGGRAIERIRIPSLPAGAGREAMGGGRNLTLNLGGERYELGASNDVIGRLERHVAREALRKGGRR
jgi:tape measure domain-containing protein